jgi:hypothetical protein
MNSKLINLQKGYHNYRAIQSLRIFMVHEHTYCNYTVRLAPQEVSIWATLELWCINPFKYSVFQVRVMNDNLYEVHPHRNITQRLCHTKLLIRNSDYEINPLYSCGANICQMVMSQEQLFHRGVKIKLAVIFHICTSILYPLRISRF